MSTKEIFKNIGYFIETVLRNAYFDKDWNRESIKNAMKWAQYCEKIYDEAKDKPVAAQFDDYLKTLNSSVIPTINFDFLKKSRKVLIMALLQNPYLSRDLISMLLQENQNDETLKDDLCQIIKLKSCFLMLEEWTKLETSDHLVMAHLALESMCNKFAVTQDKLQKETLITNFFTTLINFKNGLVCLLDIWCIPASIRSNIKHIQSMLMEHFLLKITPEESQFDENIVRMIFESDPTTVSKLCVIYPVFCKKYCNHLVNYGHKSKLCFGTNGAQWMSSNDSSQESYLSYDNLVSHFKSLSTISELREDIFKLLNTLSSESICSIWEDILNEIK